MSRRSGRIFALGLALFLALAPGLAFARAGGGGSFGSRGSRTFSAPPTTSTAPYSASPFQRSLTPQPAPYAAPGYNRGLGGSAFGGRSPFVSGLMGGLIGAGIGGLLFGGGLFGGVSGFGGFLGLLLQIFLVALVARWVFRRFFSRQTAMAGGPPGLFARGAVQDAPRPGMGRPASAPVRVEIAPRDYQEFERLLKSVQAAWSGQDLNAIRQITTPEMVSYFAEQIAEQQSRGVRNSVTDVRLDRGDLSEAWAEPGREYATVAMRFSMIDVTTDSSGRIVDGSSSERVMVTEIWTFLRAPGGRWLLSGIQQTR